MRADPAGAMSRALVVRHSICKKNKSGGRWRPARPLETLLEPRREAGGRGRRDHGRGAGTARRALKVSRLGCGVNR
eukprot:991984-Prymnesium_polylepis.1